MDDLSERPVYSTELQQLAFARAVSANTRPCREMIALLSSATREVLQKRTATPSGTRLTRRGYLRTGLLHKSVARTRSARPATQPKQPQRRNPREVERLRREGKTR